MYFGQLPAMTVVLEATEMKEHLMAVENIIYYDDIIMFPSEVNLVL